MAALPRNEAATDVLDKGDNNIPVGSSYPSESQTIAPQGNPDVAVESTGPQTVSVPRP